MLRMGTKTKATPERGLPITPVLLIVYTPPAPANFRDWKHSRQNTGRPCVGRNGTVVSFPQAEQLVVVSTRSRPTPPPPDGRAARLALQLLQRFGSFLKFLSAKNSCSPAVQTKGSPQSTQLRVLSWNSITTSLTRPFYPATLTGCRDPARRPNPRLHNHPRGPGPADSPTPLLARCFAARCAPVARSLWSFVTLVRLAALLFARSLTRERLLGATPIAWFQIEGMLLDIFDDIFLLHLPLEPAKRALDGLAILHFHFSQARLHPLRGRLHLRSRAATCASVWASGSVGIR